MPTRTTAQKHELNDHFRRASRDPNKTSSFRKEAYRRLLDLATDTDDEVFCKKLMAERVKDFFADFPEFQHEAINVVYDMCEAEDQEVRIAGYTAITFVSRTDKSWLSRNADVLAQLLQSDDEREVTIIKRSLQEHIELDPRTTLEILCHLCVFDGAELPNDDDRILRERWRASVLKFLVEKYRACIARVVKDREVEDMLFNSMVKAIPQATPAEVHMVLTEVLLNLPCIRNHISKCGTTVLQALLDSARKILESDTPNIEKLNSAFQQASLVTSTLRQAITGTPDELRQPSVRPAPVADPLCLLRFFTDEELMRRLPLEVILNTVDTALGSYNSAMTYADMSKAQILMLNASPFLLNLLTRLISVRRDSSASRACFRTVQAMNEILVTRETHLPPTAFAAAAKALISGLSSTSSTTGSGESFSMEADQALELSRSLLELVEERSRANAWLSSSDPRERGRHVRTESTKHARPHLANRIPSILPRPLSKDGTTVGEASASSNGMDVSSGCPRDMPGDMSLQARKKIKGKDGTALAPQADSGDSVPSLLSRLGSRSPAPSKDQAKVRPTKTSGDAHLLSYSTQIGSGLGVRPAQNPSEAVSVGGGVPRSARLTLLPPNGGTTTSSSLISGKNDHLIQKEPQRRQTTGPMEINILGASRRGDDGEIKIKGAAERREGGEVKTSNGLGVGGLSLLARLSNSKGDVMGDHTSNRKRKRTR